MYALYSRLLFLIVCSFSSTLGLFLTNEVHEGVLEILFFFTKSILFPGIVKDFFVEIVSSHASLPNANTLFIVWCLLKFKLTAELHELLELNWVSLAKLRQWGLTLLLLDIVVFFIL